MEVITRKEALNQGRKQYFTGKPYKHGHIEERRVSNKSCLGCIHRLSKGNPEERDKRAEAFLKKDGQLHHRTQNLVGQKFGLLTCTAASGSDGKKRSWQFVCECGSTVIKVGTEIKKQIKRGYTPSCGCLTLKLQQRAKSHGLSKHPAYAVYRSMIDRCALPSHQAWKNYGGRGITVFETWQESFEVFWADMGPTYQPGLSLDRIDNDRGYSKDNCRWTTRTTQANNRRGNVRIQTRWGSLTVAEASRKSGIGNSTIHYRLAQGWPTDKLLIPASPSNRIPTT